MPAGDHRAPVRRAAARLVVYLILRDLQAQHGSGGVYIADSIKEQVYSISRDVYEHHRALTAYGLLHRLDDPNRRPDGKIAHRSPLDMGPYPHQFRLVREGLDRDALPVVSTTLSQGW